MKIYDIQHTFTKFNNTNDTASTTSRRVFNYLPASALKTMTTSVHSIILHSGKAIVISLFTELGTVRAKSLNATGFETMNFLPLQDA